jgi:type IV pilus assembly protein PilA
MKKYLQKKLKNEKGMTLIELLAVIVIIAIIAAIAIPAIGNLIQNSRENALIADAQNVMSAASIYFAENSDQDDVTAATLLTDEYLESTGQIDSAIVTNASPNVITFTGTAGNTTFTDVETNAADLAENGRGELE